VHACYTACRVTTVCFWLVCHRQGHIRSPTLVLLHFLLQNGIFRLTHPYSLLHILFFCTHLPLNLSFIPTTSEWDPPSSQHPPPSHSFSLLPCSESTWGGAGPRPPLPCSGVSAHTGDGHLSRSACTSAGHPLHPQLHAQLLCLAPRKPRQRGGGGGGATVLHGRLLPAIGCGAGEPSRDGARSGDAPAASLSAPSTRSSSAPEAGRAGGAPQHDEPIPAAHRRAERKSSSPGRGRRPTSRR
jgi:hypothetical protein